jgi:hypothetical protein
MDNRVYMWKEFQVKNFVIHVRKTLLNFGIFQDFFGFKSEKIRCFLLGITL